MPYDCNKGSSFSFTFFNNVSGTELPPNNRQRTFSGSGSDVNKSSKSFSITVTMEALVIRLFFNASKNTSGEYFSIKKISIHVITLRIKIDKPPTLYIGKINNHLSSCCNPKFNVEALALHQ